MATFGQAIPSAFGHYRAAGTATALLATNLNKLIFEQDVFSTGPKFMPNQKGAKMLPFAFHG